MLRMTPGLLTVPPATVKAWLADCMAVMCPGLSRDTAVQWVPFVIREDPRILLYSPGPLADKCSAIRSMLKPSRPAIYRPM